jgi:riboflavin synthase
MFTGIIRAKGQIDSIEPRGGDLRITVRAAGLPWQDYAIGESISVNGVCLTAVDLQADGFVADVSVETMDVTALGELSAGSEVNLEPAMAVGERLGGHIVSGHVDCIGTLKAREQDARSVRLEFEIPRKYCRYVVRKGSICIDGVSLTINEVSGNGFGVNIIPHTVDVTIIGGYRTGTRVNIEVDLLARYLERLISHADDDDQGGITKDFLRVHGYE